MKIGFRTGTASIIGAAAFATLVATAPSALADPVAPVLPQPVPAPVIAPAPAPGPGAPAEPVAPLAAPVVPVSGDPAAVPLAVGPLAPVEVPHLASPDNLPPGTSTTPTTQTKLGYFRDLWHAMRTQEVSGSDALLLLTQRPMNSGPATQSYTGPAPVAPPAPAAPDASAPVAPVAPVVP
ncbi:hypothetical protein [Mycobacterium sp. 236(2023)]|uniref:hypothetical protein n=1 Tax=Mycobacterium sp. 236(2023) TaxID=3038163 RepID=UPI0024156AE2|nr:hypothetical protein [Mycobacterium sp. 236(2023)]MDG4666762.1 hypothetical protein [Mycobacterium sp. 236(2023)]